MAYSKEFRANVLAHAQCISGTSFPVDLFAIAAGLDVVEIESRAMAIDGYLAKRDDGRLAIRYKEGVTLERTRFTIAHEIGHILISIAEGQPIVDRVARSMRSNDEEMLANKVAASLLMPAPAITYDLNRQMADYGYVFGLLNKYQVSRSAFERRLVELTNVFTFTIDVVDGKRAPYLRNSAGYRVLFPSHPRELQKAVLKGWMPRSLDLQVNGIDLSVKCISRRIDAEQGVAVRTFGWVPTNVLSAGRTLL